jgi:hypothetical protein
MTHVLMYLCVAALFAGALVRRRKSLLSEPSPPNGTFLQP